MYANCLKVPIKTQFFMKYRIRVVSFHMKRFVYHDILSCKMDLLVSLSLNLSFNRWLNVYAFYHLISEHETENFVVAAFPQMFSE